MRRDGSGDTDLAGSFGAILRTLRKNAGISQAVLAELTSVSVAAIGSYEQGLRRAPYRHTVLALSRALKLSPEESKNLERAADDARRGSSTADRRLTGESGTNLPAPATSFIPRAEVSELMGLMNEHRLVTITGSGGIGKTRTAIAVAAGWSTETGHEAFFVDLASIQDGASVIAQVASILKVSLEQGTDPANLLAKAIRTRDVLLIMDNCEHLVSEIAPLVTALLRDCPSLSILATSRERLQLSSETVFRLPSLDVPPASKRKAAQGERFAAVELFVTRARSADARYEFSERRLQIAAEICRKLDGIPLAIELAASQLPTLGSEELLRRIQAEFGFIGSSDLPKRQQTMLATIEWSYALLTFSERTVMRRLCVFVNGFSLSAVESICPDFPDGEATGVLLRLVHKSIVNVTHLGEATRYSLLESIKSFGLKELLAAAEFQGARTRHLEWVGGLAERASADLPAQIDRLLPDFENVRLALRWAFESADEDGAVVGARIVNDLNQLWWYNGGEQEHESWSDKALNRIDRAKHPHVAARLLYNLTFPEAKLFAAAARALPALEQVGDTDRLAKLQARLAMKFTVNDRFEEALNALLQARRVIDAGGGPSHQAFSLYCLAACDIHCLQGNFSEARSHLSAFQASFGTVGSNIVRESYSSIFAAHIEFFDGNQDRARELCEQFVEKVAGDERYRFFAVEALLNLAFYRLHVGATQAAARAAVQVLQAEVSSVSTIAQALQHLLVAAADQGHWSIAARGLGCVERYLKNQDVLRLSLEQDRSHDMLLSALRAHFSDDDLSQLRTQGTKLRTDELRDELLQIYAE